MFGIDFVVDFYQSKKRRRQTMIDRYTKAVLTVIAVCLCLITAQNINIVPSAEASGHDVQKVAICSYLAPKQCAAVSMGKLSVAEY
jgi:hypothetical protein